MKGKEEKKKRFPVIVVGIICCFCHQQEAVFSLYLVVIQCLVYRRGLLVKVPACT